MVDLGDLREGYFEEEHLAEAINYAAFYFDLYGQELDAFIRDEQLATTEDFIKKV